MRSRYELGRTARGLIAAAGVCVLQACGSSPHATMAPDPQFGRTHRAALKAQELPPVAVDKAPDAVPFLELEAGLQSQQTAKPPATIAPRNGRSPSGLVGQ